jgi:sugar/nucleoside kinase (ribokinase family)
MINGILDRRKRECSAELKAPIFVWEPVPDLCTPEELDNCKHALQIVDYVSPNHEELAAFYNAPGTCGDGVNRVLIENCAADWLHSAREGGKLKAVIVRAGKEGCCVAENTACQWIPAYHQNSERVIDPTGGGNAFLGGLGIELARGSRVIDAAISGSVAASFAIEQVGVPKLTSVCPGDERWNGERAVRRVEELRRQLS